jgi:hypothetical protein
MKSKKQKTYKKYPSACTPDMTFDECELAVLRHAVDEADMIKGEKLAKSDQIVTLIRILEDFLIRKKRICYGGTAINDILPKHAQFYNRDIEIPDYDFYSPDAMRDAKELSDIYYREGYADVEAKSGVHHGTYKVYVNFIPIADITNMDPDIYKHISEEAVSIAGIKYAPPNFLRMGMYLELSRPAGDTTRWEKVLKRLTLLNKYYPLRVGYNCEAVDFQRKMESHSDDSEKIYYIIRDVFIEMGVVFFGGYANSLYSRYMPEKEQKLVQAIPDFDVLYEDPEKCSNIIKERLEESGFKRIQLLKHQAVGELIPEHIEIRYDKECLAFIYKPIACHNYNIVNIGHREVNIATIDTILSFYLAFMYAGMPYYHKDRILCMAKFLFEIQRKSRLNQNGILRRFHSTCYGVQETMESIRAKKAEKFKELKKKYNEKEFQEWFFKYIPSEVSVNKKEEKEEKEGETPVKEDKVRPKEKKRKTQRGFKLPTSFQFF